LPSTIFISAGCEVVEFVNKQVDFGFQARDGGTAEVGEDRAIFILYICEQNREKCSFLQRSSFIEIQTHS